MYSRVKEFLKPMPLCIYEADGFIFGSNNQSNNSNKNLQDSKVIEKKDLVITKNIADNYEDLLAEIKLTEAKLEKLYNKKSEYEKNINLCLGKIINHAKLSKKVLKK